MDLYLTSLAIGGMGLVAMAFSGFGRHGSNSGSSHGHSGSSSVGHGHAGQGSHTTTSHPVVTNNSASHASAHAANHSQATSGSSSGRSVSDSASSALLSVMSPRVLFSVCIGLGTVGLLLRRENIPLISGGLPLFAAALLGGILFERILVTPIWNFAFKFASNPALTLESALMGEATAVTRFDANGQGLIAIEVDGHLVQLLGTLQKTDIPQLERIQVGARLRVEEVDSARNRCTVSLL